MKKSIVTLFLIGYMLPLFATHIVGGSMTYEHLQDNEYKIRLEVLRDCFNGEPPFDDPAAIGMFGENNELLDYYLLDFDPTIDDTISLTTGNDVCELPPFICIHRTYYEFTLTVEEKSTLVYQRCCRSFIIANLFEPGDIGMSFMVNIDPDLENNSAVFNQEIPSGVFVNVPFVYDASATDLDGDSLVYQLTAPIQGPTPDNPLPQPPNAPPYDEAPFLLPTYSIENMLGGDYPLTIDAQTGEMSAIPVTLGSFQVAYKILEYRNGEHINTIFREFTFSVVPQIADLNFDVSGQVFVDNDLPLDFGKVRLLERDITTDSLIIVEEQVLDENGGYQFENIAPGVFYIKAFVDQASIYYDQYLPTYYGGSAFWFNAENMNQCDTSQQYRDIYLLSGMPMQGNSSIHSVIWDNATYDPIPNLDLFLTTTDGELIQARTTDEMGNFKFENLLENEEYFVLVDLINSNIDNSNPAYVFTPMELGTYIGFLFDDYLEFFIIENDSEVANLPRRMQIFPNPNKGLFTLNLKEGKMKNGKIEIHDFSGKNVGTFPINESTNTFDVSHLAAGIYTISLFENGNFLEKERILILPRN